MRKIIIVTGDIVFGGAERISVYLANYFSEMGIETYLITPSSTKSVYKLSNVNHISLDIKKDIRSTKRYRLLIKKLRKYIININPDAILGIMSYYGAAASIASIGLNIPVVVSERIDPQNTKGRTKLQKLFFKVVFYFLINGVVFQTKEAMKYYPKLVQKKSVIIPNPIINKNIPRKIDTKEDSKIIISVGRLTDQKNHKLLIRAFSKLVHYYPGYKLIIYGEGEKRKELEKIIYDNDLKDKVLLPGTNKNIFNKLLKADIFVLSSDYEGMPNALIEAMAVGLPVISTDCKGGGASFLIKNEVNGLLVPIRDEEALVNAIERLINDENFEN